MKNEYMKILYYFFRYALIMLIGYLLKYVVIYSIFNLPYIIIIAYNYLAILYSIKKPLEIRRDIRFNKLLCPLMLMTTLLNTIFMALLSISFSRWFIISIINIIELIFMKPNYEKNEEKTQKYIEEYFRNKNK